MTATLQITNQRCSDSARDDTRAHFTRSTFARILVSQCWVTPYILLRHRSVRRLWRVLCPAVCCIRSSPGLVVLVWIRTHLKRCVHHTAEDFWVKQSPMITGRRRSLLHSSTRCGGIRCD